MYGIICGSAKKSGVYLPQVEALRVVRDVDDGPKTDRFWVWLACKGKQYKD
jgi:hypothetical protein